MPTPPALPFDLALEGERLRLRAIRESDLAPIYAATRDAEFMAGQSWDAPADPAAMRRFYDGTLERWREGRVHQFSSELRATGEFVGVVALIPQPSPAPAEDGGGDRVFHVGYFTVPAHQRRGYAREGLEILLAHVFGPLGADAALAAHALFNAGSAAVLARAGFRRIRVKPAAF